MALGSSREIDLSAVLASDSGHTLSPVHTRAGEEGTGRHCSVGSKH